MNQFTTIASKLARDVPIVRRTARWVYERLHARHGVAVSINGRSHRVSAMIARGIPSRIDSPALPVWLDFVRGRDAAVDAGANIGLWSVLAAAEMSPGGRLLAVEPGPGAFHVLTDCARVSEASARILPVHAALGDRGGVGFLKIDSPLAATNRLTDGDDEAGTVEVPLITLDELLFERQLTPAAIKIDVEGAELHVLRGARVTLREVRPLVVLELHWGGSMGVSPDALLDLASESRYALYDEANGPIASREALARRNFVIMRPLVAS